MVRTAFPFACAPPPSSVTTTSLLLVAAFGLVARQLVRRDEPATRLTHSYIGI
jgi:hypothetical protein